MFSLSSPAPPRPLQSNKIFSLARIAFWKTNHRPHRDTLKVFLGEHCDETLVWTVGAGYGSERGNRQSFGRGTGPRRNEPRSDGAAAGAPGRTRAETRCRVQNPNESICCGSDTSRRTGENIRV